MRPKKGLNLASSLKIIKKEEGKVSSANTALFFFKQHFSGGVSSELIIEPPSNQLMLPNNAELCAYMSSELT